MELDIIVYVLIPFYHPDLSRSAFLMQAESGTGPKRKAGRVQLFDFVYSACDDFAWVNQPQSPPGRLRRLRKGHGNA
jgi:hypothetical protein